MEKKIYRIPCNWVMYGIMEIEATDLDEAIEMAYDAQPLPEGSFVEDSFDVDQSAIYLYNEEEKPMTETSESETKNLWGV